MRLPNMFKRRSPDERWYYSQTWDNYDYQNNTRQKLRSMQGPYHTEEQARYVGYTTSSVFVDIDTFYCTERPEGSMPASILDEQPANDGIVVLEEGVIMTDDEDEASEE